jgi:hypothetical protein
MAKPRSPDQLTALQLEQIALGEWTPPQPLTPEQQAQVQALRESSAQILSRYPAAPQAEQIAARRARAQAESSAQRPRRMPLWLPTLAGAAAVLSLVLWTTRDGSQTGTLGPAGGDTIVAKGGAAAPSLRVYRQGAAHVEPLPSGAPAHGGDLVQLALVPGPARYAVLLSIDGGGGVTLHFPRQPGEPTQLTGAAGPQGERSEIRLPQAFRLDDAPGFERFFLLTTDEAHRDSLRVADLLDRARRLAADPARAQSDELPELPPGVAQTSHLLRKDAR